MTQAALCEIAEAFEQGSRTEVDQLVAFWRARGFDGDLSGSDRCRRNRAPPPRVVVDRLEARTAAWYEFFPRSAEGSGERGSTLRDCLPRIEYAKTMGLTSFISRRSIRSVPLTAKDETILSSLEPDDPGSSLCHW